MMNLLAIDTSTDIASVAISSKGKIYKAEQGGLQKHAEYLLPLIESLLLSANLSLEKLDAIVFGSGPGSFTGLRIACSVAKGIGFAKDLPLFPVSSLLAIASHAYLTEKRDVNILAMIDARMNQVYWGCYNRELDIVEEQVSSISDITINVEKPIILAGVGFEAYEALLPKEIQAKIIHKCQIYPKAEAMIRLVEAKKIKVVSAEDALPIYVRNQVAHVAKKGV